MTKTRAVKAPRTIEAATILCGRYAELDGQIGAINLQRDADIAAINADADRALGDLIRERDAIEAKVLPWFEANRSTLLTGKRKSLELGGVMLSVRKASVAMDVTGDKDAIVSSLRSERWGKSFLAVSYRLDAKAVIGGLEGKHGDKLKALGLGSKGGEDVASMKATAQAGVQV